VRVGLVVAALALGCDKEHPPQLPNAEVYEKPVAVNGEWRGEVGGLAGTLDLTPLGRDRYRGVFEASGRSMLYVLNVVHVRAPGPDGAPMPSNLMRFDWQDGRGDRGAGWLLVNEDGSTITGSFGRGDGNTDGAGEWTMVRGEGGEVTNDDGDATPPEPSPTRERRPGSRDRSDTRTR
jgi:hypothetical protein